MSERAKAARSVIHTPAHEGSAREFLSVAIRISVAGGGKDGFFVQLFPDQRAAHSIYVTGPQLERLLALVEDEVNETVLWAELAKIPIEPLLPARSLYGRFRTLLLDSAAPLREEIARQRERADARARPPIEPEPQPGSEAQRGTDAASSTSADPMGQRPMRDPDAL